MEHSSATLIGSLGVALLLLAFFLNLFKFLRSEAYVYVVLNFVGGAMACYSSYLIDFMPFVILEGTWSAVAAVALVRKTLGHAGTPGHG
jgi:hypothetical protein